MACWDITGKVYNVPVWKLIGPKLRDSVRLYADTPEQSSTSALQQLIQHRLDLGMTWFKMDFGLGKLSQNSDYTNSPETMPAGFGTAYRVNDSGMTKWKNYVAAYRSEIGPTPPLSSDHYGNIDVASAINLANTMVQSPYKLTWLEDVVPWYFPALLTQIKAATTMDIHTGEDMYLREEFESIINANAVSSIHPDQATSGGIHETRILSEWAWTKGIPTALHFSGTPVSFAANLHIAAGLHGLMALEHHFLDVSWWDSLADGIDKPIVQKGYAAVPEGPGLGVTPNAAAVSAHLSSGGFFTQ
jgi:L-alanine-DL-glutamate epimerase-like enolase superfamily enzyme